MDTQVQNTHVLLARALLLYLCFQVCSPQCAKPCQCPNSVPTCPKGVSLVPDGCGCCRVCARQKGEACNDTLVCDKQRGLECDHSASLPGGPGECVSQEELGCELNGNSYQEGEVFQPSCATRCKCSGGGVTCVPLCSDDVRLPSPDCPHPQRVQLPGKCCKEWVCENFDNSVLQDAQTTYSQTQRLRPLPGYQAGSAFRCLRLKTEWSACSQTCGEGISTRMSNQNAFCRLEQEVRLCMIRPCGSYQLPQWPRTCQSSYRSPSPTYLVDQGCFSKIFYRARYCGWCTDGRWCTPYETRTEMVPFRCPGDHIVDKAVMIVDSCVCSYNYPKRTRETHSPPYWG